MTDDLVKRLREYRIGCGIHCSAYDAREPLDECIEAAGRIEKLESGILEYSNVVANFLLQNEELNCAFNRVIDRWEEQSTRIEQLEAALKELLSLGSWGTNDLARTIILEALETNDA